MTRPSKAELYGPVTADCPECGGHMELTYWYDYSGNALYPPDCVMEWDRECECEWDEDQWDKLADDVRYGDGGYRE